MVAIVKMLGIPGQIKPVIVYVRPKDSIQWEVLIPAEKDPSKRRPLSGFPYPDIVQKIRLLKDVTGSDFEVVETAPKPANQNAGLKWPVIAHPWEPWHLMLHDSLGVLNSFEGCVKFTPDSGEPKWYPAGTAYKGLDKVQKVIPTVFKYLSWFDKHDTFQKNVVDYAKP